MGESERNRFVREREIFFSALEKKTEESRIHYLREECGGDEAMLDRIQEMLRCHHNENSETFMVNPAVRVDSPARAGYEAGGGTEGEFHPDPKSISDLIPGLEILELLGAGGMGAVYKAKQPKLERFVAVKLLPESLGSDPQFKERFLREAQTLAKLDHPNIVTIHDVGEAGQFLYFVMEHVDGVDLAHTLKSEKMALEVALGIIPQICDALEYAHGQGVVHRDIKPANILLNKGGSVKIADFGLAKILKSDAPQSDLTKSDVAMGTPRYMAPEQFETPLDVDHRADIYSVGVLFYEMLTGELPVGNFKVPSKKIEVDVRIDEVVMRALAKEPQLRYQRASEVKEEVKKATTEIVAKSSPKKGGRRWAIGVAAIVALSAVAIWAGFFGAKPRSNSLGMQFVPASESGLLISVWETRVSDFKAFASETGHHWNRPEFVQTPDDPAVNIGFDDAEAFCDWLTEKERLDGKLREGERYRLPTDEEWSMAVGLDEERGSTPETRHAKLEGVYPWGTLAPAPSGAGNYPDTALKERFPASKVIPGYYDGFATTAPVGSFPPNGLGIYDLGGNVAEWTSTPFSKGNPHPVLRGGSWWNSFRHSNWDTLLSSWRRHDVGDGILGQSLNDVGFRVVLELRVSDGGGADSAASGLLEAANRGDLALATSLIDAGKAGPNESNAEGITPLMLAAKRGFGSLANGLLDRGAEVDAVDGRGRTALAHAVAGKNLEVVRILLDRGSRVLARDNSGKTSIERAIATGQEEILEALIGHETFSGEIVDLVNTSILLGNSAAAALLLKRAGKIVFKDSSGAPLLCNSVMFGRDKISALLIEAGADPNLRYPNGFSPLGIAAMLGNRSMAELLLDHGAQLDSGEEKSPILHLAARAGFSEMVDLLIARGADPLSKTSNGATALASAAAEPATDFLKAISEFKRMGLPPETTAALETAMANIFSAKPGRNKRAIVRRLLEEGVSVDAADAAAVTPLNVASHSGSLGVVEELVARGASIEKRDDLEFTPLLSAAEEGHLEVVKYLDEAGGDVFATASQNRTALHLAVLSGKLDLVAYLVSKGVDVEARDSDGFAPLHFAAYSGFAEITRFLLENGASPTQAMPLNADHGSEYTPLHFAAGGIGMLKSKQRETDVSRALGKTKNAGQPIDRGTPRDHIATMAALIKGGADVKALDGAGNPPLTQSARWDFVEGVEFLLEQGAKTDGAGSGGSALIVASVEGSAGAAAALLKHGADHSAVDGHSATALHWAALCGHGEIVDLLIEGGADIEARDLNYCTPLHQAASRGNLDVVRVLCEKGASRHARSVDGMTPAQYARFSGHDTVSSYLARLRDRKD